MIFTHSVLSCAKRYRLRFAVFAWAVTWLSADTLRAAEMPLFEAWRGTGQYRVYAEGMGVSASGGNGTFENVSISGPVTKAYLYWIGANLPAVDVASDDTVTFTRQGGAGVDVTADNGYVVPFEKPLSPGSYFWNANHSSFVADVTDLIQEGTFDYAVSDFDMDQEYGFGLQIVYEDDAAPENEVAIFQGHDFAFSGWANGGELNRTDVVHHTFEATPYDRYLEVTFFSGGGEDTNRPDQLWMLTGTHDTRDALPSELITNNMGIVIDDNPLEADEEHEWDTVEKKVLIPAGSTYAAFQFQSGGGSGTNTPDESFSWISGAFQMHAIPEPATIMLLGSGALCVLRRRRKA